MNDMVLSEAQQQLAVMRPPEIVLEEARRAAVALKEVIQGKTKKVEFNGEQYLEFEDWQTVGRFYGISPRVTATRYVEFGEARGWEATAEAVQVATERIVSKAESMCLNDEEKWRARPKYEWHYVKKSGGTSLEDPGRDDIIWEKGKEGKNRPKKQRILAGEESVPLFQLRSMAQTRACAKAMRNALAWVVVLAGFKPTPAEEMDGAIESHRKLHGEKDMGPADVVKDDEQPAWDDEAQHVMKVSPEQVEAIHVALSVNEVSLENFLAYFAKVNDIRDLDQSRAMRAVDWIREQKTKREGLAAAKKPAGAKPDAEDKPARAAA